MVESMPNGPRASPKADDASKSKLKQNRSLMPDCAQYSPQDAALPTRSPSLGLSGAHLIPPLTVRTCGKTGFLREIREQVRSWRRAFVNGFVHLWTFAAKHSHPALPTLFSD